MKKYETIEQFIEANNFTHIDPQRVSKTIMNTLDCGIKEVSNFQLLLGGYMNDVFTFEYANQKYVYRYPGVNSEKIINRKAEHDAHLIAKQIGLDPSLISITNEGDKISAFIDDYRYFDYTSTNDQKLIVKLMQKLHNAKVRSNHPYNIIKEIDNYLSLNSEYGLKIYPDLLKIKDEVMQIYATLDYENSDVTLCHHDIYTTNILISEDQTYLIDWEFSNDAHPALDLCTFFVCSPYTLEEIDNILKAYLEDQYNVETLIEYYSYFIVGAYYWLLWALHTENHGGDTEGFVERYYTYLNLFIKHLHELQESFQ